jgi:hypothetical protein
MRFGLHLPSQSLANTYFFQNDAGSVCAEVSASRGVKKMRKKSKKNFSLF